MVLPPTSHLPPIKRIASYPISSLNEALDYLRQIYNPPVRGSRRRTTSKKDASRLLDALRTDAFEQAYAIKWLTVLISQLGESEDVTNASEREAIVESGAALLAVCAGTASAGTITRQFAFEPSPESSPGAQPIVVNLKDIPLENRDYGSLGAQTWGGACIMAEMIVENPATFGLLPGRPLRCLELGAGTGLVSLTVAKVLQGILGKEIIESQVVATDFYPSVLANLKENIRSNFYSTSPRIDSVRLDWSEFCSSDPSNDLEILQSPFDVVYGADIVYEAQHSVWIKRCARKVLRKPSQKPSLDAPTFHLIIPLRKTHTVESETIEAMFKDQNEIEGADLVIKHKEIIICDADSGEKGEEIEYAYYRIGWP
ncbi:unnamed protein product [Cyclocybe aegerita]|uniref:Uncharacterized protein n=1 Tax=Cyclocybe aegerita TaxID=1973307 RepID=A0A8S0WSB9_CYCAE|nr:unnamed protein product [Cyclocybe aegerita]